MGRKITEREEEILKDIGKTLQKLRKKNKKTLKEVSNEINISSSDISKYENGTRGDISLLTLNKFCKYYNCKLSSILYNCNESTSSIELNQLLKNLNKYNNKYNQIANKIIEKIENQKLEKKE